MIYVLIIHLIICSLLEFFHFQLFLGLCFCYGGHSLHACFTISNTYIILVSNVEGTSASFVPMF